MDPDAFARAYPQIFHMAEQENWPAILERGLLSTSELLDQYRYTGAEREKIEAMHRPECVTIRAPGLPPAVIRDQAVLKWEDLEPLLLDGHTPASWCRLINGKVFFWAERYRLDFLLGARNYRGVPHVVLTIDTAALMTRYAERTTVTTINSGSALPTRRGPEKRGNATFQPLAAFRGGRAIEVAVERRVDGIDRIAVRSELWLRNGPSDEPTMLKVLWTRKG